MNPEELFGKLINNQITREEFELLLDGLDDERIRARYDKYLEEKFMEELDSHLIESTDEPLDETRDVLNPDLKLVRRKQTKRKYSFLSYPKAAVILGFIGVAISAFYVITQNQKVEQNRYSDNGVKEQIITKRTPSRKMFRTRLQDGSFVHLNAASSISYPQKFSNNQREVEISGEAYFDIERDETRPFNIKVKDYTVQVLGTSFNIKAYQEEDDFSVTVESGKVRVVLNNEEINPVVLTSNQKLIYSRESDEMKIISVNAEDELSWRKGILRFNSTTMAEVEKMLERWYGVEIIIDNDSIYEKEITGVHQNENLKSVLESLTFATKTKYLIKDNSIIIKN